MVHAHCRGCDVTGPREEVCKKTRVQKEVFDQCVVCTSIDIDILSDEGLRHERMEQAS